jgi:NhaP-type Na+/H+ or K+/H+ antiporter
LHELGEFGLHWVLVDVLWATTAAIAIGVASGSGVAYLVVRLRRDCVPCNRLAGLSMVPNAHV